MNTNITIGLDTRRSKQDGSYPIILRLGHNARTTSIPTGYSVKEKDWDDRNKVVKKSHEGTTTVTRLNNIIQKQRSDAMDIILKLHETEQLNLLSVSALKERLVNQGKINSFFHYAEEQIAQLKKANRIGTARSYSGVVNVLKKFTGKKDITFQEISYSFINKFEVFHKSKGNGANGLSVYLRAIRAIYNKAIKEGIVEKELYPFAEYKIKSSPTQKRALEWDLLKKIIYLELQPDDICFNSRNYFIASYLMYGMNFTDMAFLQKSDIACGRITYRRKKTSKLYDIKITDKLQTILDYYIKAYPDSIYVFPIIKRDTPILMEKDIQWARKRYNKKLKILAEKCGIEKNLTSYVSRHSFATQAMMQNVPLNAISSMLGHSSLKTTEVYLKSLPTNILDDYNKLIMGE